VLKKTHEQKKTIFRFPFFFFFLSLFPVSPPKGLFANHNEAQTRKQKSQKRQRRTQRENTTESVQEKNDEKKKKKKKKDFVFSSLWCQEGVCLGGRVPVCGRWNCERTRERGEKKKKRHHRWGFAIQIDSATCSQQRSRSSALHRPSISI
jgi:hypothetical protein